MIIDIIANQTAGERMSGKISINKTPLCEFPYWWKLLVGTLPIHISTPYSFETEEDAKQDAIVWAEKFDIILAGESANDV